MRAAEVDALLGPEPVHDLELLGEHREPRGGLREREAVRAVLALHPAGAEAELDPAAGNVVDGRGGVREQARQAEGGGRDERAEAERRRAGGKPASVVQASCATLPLSFDCEM